MKAPARLVNGVCLNTNQPAGAEQTLTSVSVERQREEIVTSGHKGTNPFVFSTEIRPLILRSLMPLHSAMAKLDGASVPKFGPK
jgi:hypothetical protein